MNARRELTGLLGRYRILSKLGEGGMGAVYLAEDTQLGRKVALKVPHFDAKTKPAIIERFQREAKLAASIDHPNLCAVFEVGTVNDIHYFTMPFIRGTPLSELIMVRDGGEPVLMDFGLARSFNSGAQRLTATGAPLGSPPYMAPEQVNGSGHYTPATDVYGLGVIFYELVTGKLPFEAPHLLALFGQVLTTPAPPPSQRRPGVDPRLDAFCLKALAKKPEDRFADTTSMMAALSATLRQLATRSQSPPPELSGDTLGVDPRSFSQTSPVDLNHSAVIGALPSPTRRSPWLMPVVVLMAMLLGVGLIYLAMRRNDPPTPTVAANPATHTLDLDGVKLEMVRVGKGQFWMGSPADEAGRASDDQEQHEVAIAEDFYIGKYEVTQEQWQAVMGTGVFA